ncbi:MAG: hypothetical protein HW421_2615 [Ignavibacteria bacterium]|nr:hypothetical protein [Ignavibacteria bacterium]
MDKTIIFTNHALTRIAKRGTTQEEVAETIELGKRETAKENKLMCRLNFPYNKIWIDTSYPIKQVAPIIVEEGDEIIVITVYTFYF